MLVLGLAGGVLGVVGYGLTVATRLCMGMTFLAASIEFLGNICLAGYNYIKFVTATVVMMVNSISAVSGLLGRCVCWCLFYYVCGGDGDFCLRGGYWRDEVRRGYDCLVR